MTVLRASIAVVAASLCLVGCADPDPPSGLYVATCDAEATLTFEANGTVRVNDNYCEGYALLDAKFEQDGETITMPSSDNPKTDPVVFEIGDEGILTLKDEGWNFTCGNCKPGDTWKQAQ